VYGQLKKSKKNLNKLRAEEKLHLNYAWCF
jgi:hypothetical protein